MKITIITFLLLMIALPVHGAITVPSLPPYNDGTYEHIEFKPAKVEYPKEIKRLEVSTTTVEEAKLEELRRLIVQLKALIELLKAQQG